MQRNTFINILRSVSGRFIFYHRPDEYTHSSLWFRTDCRCENCEGSRMLICAMPDDAIPEYTLFDTEDKIKLRGYREICRMILRKKHNGCSIIDRDRFLNVFHKHGIRDLQPYTRKERYKTLGATTYERQKSNLS